MLWNPERVSEGRIVRVRDRLSAEVGPALMAVDPDHIVNESMVDVRVVPTGPLDRIRADLLVTLFARRESGRVAGAAEVVDRLRRVAADAAEDEAVVVELVLNEHRSSFDYAELE